MQASILAIGDELTLGQKTDTNSAWLSAQLLLRSVRPVEHRTVDDDRAAIAAAITELAAANDVLIITGGLGPTNDDLTRHALGDVLDPGRDLVVDDDALRRLEAWFGAGMPAGNAEQALRPASMRMVPNPHGTAPGLAGRHGRCLVFALPGPPREMHPMFAEHVVPALDAAGDGRPMIATETVHLYGLGESRAAQRLGALTERGREPTVGITASQGVVTARIRAAGGSTDGATDGSAALEAIAARIEDAWAPYCFGRGETTLAGAVGVALVARQATLVTAESCTGGGLGKVIVDAPGASAYYRGGWITYADAFKTSLLGVPAALIAEHGAVSEPVARAMAIGAIGAGDADYSLAITGVAGPDGGTPDKPAGTVFIGLGARGGEDPGAEPAVATVRRFRFRGERALVRDRSAMAALQMLRFSLVGARADVPLIWEARPLGPADAMADATVDAPADARGAS